MKINQLNETDVGQRADSSRLYDLCKILMVVVINDHWSWLWRWLHRWSLIIIMKMITPVDDADEKGRHSCNREQGQGEAAAAD